MAADVGREQEYREVACRWRIPGGSIDVPTTDEIHVQTLCDRQALGVFDDMYSPEYAIRDLTEEFEKLAKEGKLPEDVNASGGEFYGTMDEAVDLFKQALVKYESLLLKN